MTSRKIFLFILSLFLSFGIFAAERKQLKKNNILVEYVPYNGGVFLSYVDAKNRKTPVIDTVDYANSSFIGVAVDKKYYNLRTSGGVKYECEVDENSLSVIYTIQKNVVLTVTYTVPHKNILNIKYTIKNKDSNEHQISIKSVFDTILGEWNGSYFSTESKAKIKSEYIITDFQKHKALTSSDGITGIRFMMDKDFAKYAYKTVIAAKPFFESDVFDGHFQEGRGFNTVLSYNNACVGIFFKTRTLKADKEVSFNHRIEFAQAVITSFTKLEDEDDDENRIYHEDNAGEGEVQPAPEVKKEEPEVISASENIVPEVQPAVKEPEPAPEPIFEQITVQEEVNQKVEKQQVNREYALSLINRIKALEDDGKNTDRAELLQLQSELNAILKQLKD